MLVGCSFDSTPIADRANGISGGNFNVSGDGDGAGSGSGAAGDSSPSGTAGSDPAGLGNGGSAGDEPAQLPSSPPSDGITEGSPDAGGTDAQPDAGAGTGVDAGAGDVDAGLDAGGGGVDAGGTVEPEPGGLFSRCTRDVGCDGELICYGTLPGQCAQPCEESDECVDHEGVDFTCSSTSNACRVDCSDEGTGGVCPTGLQCVDVDGAFRCRHPLEEGSHDEGLFEPCDLAHGDDDCADGRQCYRADDSAFDAPGYCTDGCSGGFPGSGGGSCNAEQTGAAAYVCESGTCVLDCTDDDCPDGMECEPIGEVGRCHFAP